MKTEDEGTRYGSLVSVGEYHVNDECWTVCECDCGRTVEIKRIWLLDDLPRFYAERDRNPCHCVGQRLAEEDDLKFIPNRNVIDGYVRRRHPMLSMWKEIKSICADEERKGFPSSCGKWFKMCDRWRISFAAFVVDMGPRPSREHKVHRIDPNGHWSPRNCQWMTQLDIDREKFGKIMLEHNGENLSLLEWSPRVGLSPQALNSRLNNGWSVEKTLTQMPRKKKIRGGCQTVTFHDETLPISHWSEIFGISPQALSRRLKRGWSVEEALTTPVNSGLITPF